MKEGETLTLDDLEPLAIPAEYAVRLENSAVLFEQKATLSGQTLLRDIEPGDPLFWRDTQIRGAQIEWQGDDYAAVTVPLSRTSLPPVRVGDVISFRIPIRDETSGVDKPEWIGPFRLLTVGQQRTYATGESDVRESINHLTVAFPRDKQQQHLALEKFLDRRLQGEDLTVIVRIEKVSRY